MTEAPPPRPEDETAVDHSAAPAASTAPTETVAATPAAGWPEQPVQRPSRVRQWGRQVRGSKVALVVAGLVVAAGLVLGGVALAGGDGHGDRDGRGPGAAGPRGAGDDDRGNAGRFGGDRDNGNQNNGEQNNGQNNGQNDGKGGRGGRAARGGFGGGDAAARQQVIGVITAVSSTSITIRTSGGTPSYAITATTPVTRAGAAAGVTDLKVGDAVVIRLGASGSGGQPVVTRIATG